MLDWIEVNVIHVLSKIAVIADRVFPEAALPDAALALTRAASGNVFDRAPPTRECRLDEPPACGKIAVTRGQCPQRMKVVGQNHDRFDCEGLATSGVAECRPQQFDILGKQRQAAVGEVYG